MTKSLDDLAALAVASQNCIKADRAFDVLIQAGFTSVDAEGMAGCSKSERALNRISDRLRPAQCAFVRRKARSRKERKDQISVLSDLKKAGIVV
jgi:hypothetical protein